MRASRFESPTFCQTKEKGEPRYSKPKTWRDATVDGGLEESEKQDSNHLAACHFHSSEKANLPVHFLGQMCVVSSSMAVKQLKSARRCANIHNGYFEV